MVEFFVMGGPGMYLTLGFGVLLIAAAALFAMRAEKRYLPLLASLGLGTLFSGGLAFSTGVVMTLRYLGQVAPAEQFTIAAAGVQESLNNVVLALLLLTLAAVVSSAGAVRTMRAPAQA